MEKVKELEKLGLLGKQYFELFDQSKNIKEKIDFIKEEADNILNELNVDEIKADIYTFKINSKVKRKFVKKDFAKDIGTTTKDVDEKFIAIQVENGKTSSTKIDSFYQPKVTRNIKISRPK